MGKWAQEMLSWDRAFVKKHPGKKAKNWSGLFLPECQHQRDARICGF